VLRGAGVAVDALACVAHTHLRAPAPPSAVKWS